MKLEEYIDKHSISVADFAHSIGAKSRATVYRYINGVRKMPSQEMMQKISQVTDGAVTANDFYSGFES